MFGAGATGEDGLFLESLACAMGPNGGIAGGDAGFLCERFECVLCEVNFADDFGICRLELLEDVVDALTDDLLSGRIKLSFDGKIVGPLFESAIFGGAMTIVVDHGVAQDAVEPCDGGLVAAERCGLLHRTDVGGLDDVLGGGAGAHSSLDEL